MTSFSAWSYIKRGTDAHREAAPAWEIHPVTYGTGLPLRFFPSDTVNEGIFQFPTNTVGEMLLQSPPPPCKRKKNSSFIYLREDFLVSRLSHRPRFKFGLTTQKEKKRMLLFLSIFWFEFLYVFHYTF